MKSAGKNAVKMGAAIRSVVPERSTPKGGVPMSTTDVLTLLMLVIAAIKLGYDIAQKK